MFDCYFFEKNLQGDIVAIYNESGTKIGTYTYDAWGNCTVNPTSGYNFILSNNPFRYRGYYYDTETGFYYLQSRYYNPEWGRFINADVFLNANGDIIGYNMFAYCSNNPTNYVDSSGSMAILDDLLFVGFACVLLFCTTLLAVEIIEASSENPGDIYESVSDGVDEIRKKIDELNDNHSGEYTVYYLVDDDNRIRYVGRTKNLPRRMYQHAHSEKTKNLELAYYIDGLTWSEARGLEQLGIVEYNTKNAGANSINGISDHNPNRIPYIVAAWDFIYNELTSEIYNLME